MYCGGAQPSTTGTSPPKAIRTLPTKRQCGGKNDHYVENGPEEKALILPTNGKVISGVDFS